MSRLLKKYKEQVLPELKKKYPEKNVMELPKLKKIIISMGLKDAIKDKGLMQEHMKELMHLSGQKPVMTKAKKAISNFKLKIGQPIGLKVTLRKKRMYEFFDRFCNIVCPRIRDFRGFRARGDGRGNYSIGVDEQQIFPETLAFGEVKRTQCPCYFLLFPKHQRYATGRTKRCSC